VNTSIPLHRLFGGCLRWSLSIGKKVFRVVPLCTLAVVLATLVSQIALLLAFFLPLKVVILLGSPGIPSYFPAAWQALERSPLVIFLSLGAVVFYLLYLIADKVIVFYAEKGAMELLMRSQKVNLFKNQNEIAIRAYHRYSRSLSALVFTGFALVFIGLLYPYLLIVVLGYGSIIYVLFSLAIELSNGFHIKLSGNISGLMRMLGGVGFLVAFIFMVVDFLIDPPSGVIVAIICLLLVRQLMLKVAGLIVDIAASYAQRLQINALFFHGHKFVSNKPQDSHDFWSLLDAPYKDEWVRGVLGEIADVPSGRIDCVWLQTGIANVLVFEVTFCDSSNSESYLVKVFNYKHMAVASHEASLLAECKLGAFPSPRFLGAVQVRKYHCHLFDWAEPKKNPLSECGIKGREVALWLLTYEPSKAQIDCCAHSKPLLGQRLSKVMIERLRLVVSSANQLERLDVFEQKLNQIRSRLESLPVQIINPDMHRDILKCSENGNVSLVHWGAWSIEPVGAGWPMPGKSVTEKELARLLEALELAKKSRKDLVLVSGADVKLAALMFSFEYLFIRQQYVKALALLPTIIECFDADGEDSRVV